MTVATKEKISKLYKKLKNNMGKSQSVIELTDGYSDGNIALEKEYVKSFGIVPENETSKCREILKVLYTDFMTYNPLRTLQFMKI